MQGRTFYRIMVDSLFVNNPFCKAVSAFVNFCNNSVFYNKKNLKFLKNVPLLKKESEFEYKKKFIFDSSYVCGVNSKYNVNICNK